MSISNNSKILLLREIMLNEKMYNNLINKYF